MKHIFLQKRFFYLMGSVIVLMALSFAYPNLFYISLGLLVFTGALTMYDINYLQNLRPDLLVDRKVAEQISLGDIQNIEYTLINTSDQKVRLELIDELPYQLQYRDSISTLTLDPGGEVKVNHNIRPIQRGAYDFGRILLYLSSRIDLVQIRKEFKHEETSRVYPSIIQMKKYAIQIFSMTASMFGIRKIRTLGENDEFEHIRRFQQGDNIRSINWKATSRKGELVVNQFQDTRSQMIYCIIDKGRSMEMPFDGLSLLDYSINTALVISNIVLRKYDKAGLITFNKEVETFLKAESNGRQLETILESLYKENTEYLEPNFEQLYYACRHRINRRSILFLFTNLENKHDLERNLDYIKALSKRHLLIVISFKNTELLKASQKEATTSEEIHFKTIATNLLHEKEGIMNDLRHHGIQTIYTSPADLSINIINKYLEIKAKQMK